MISSKNREKFFLPRLQASLGSDFKQKTRNIFVQVYSLVLKQLYSLVWGDLLPEAQKQPFKALFFGLSDDPHFRRYRNTSNTIL